jgi:hypothetical protein
MNSRDFLLQPFAPTGRPSDITISGSIARRADILAIRYVLRGRLAELVIPGLAAMPARRHGLWEGTCFEFFLGVKDSPGYWEINLSPAGHWNVYRFRGYRQGMAEETAFASLAFSVRCWPDRLGIGLELEIGKIVAADQPLAVAAAAVIESRDQGLTYWALTHPGDQADFHRRDSFQVEL